MIPRDIGHFSGNAPEIPSDVCNAVAFGYDAVLALDYEAECAIRAGKHCDFRELEEDGQSMRHASEIYYAPA